MSQYTIPCGQHVASAPRPDHWWQAVFCTAETLCPTCQVVRELRDALVAQLEYETLHPIPLIKPTVEEAKRYMEMIYKSTKALSRVQEAKP